MNTLLDIVNRAPNPTPWSEGDNIPWDDPAFSERMLAEHLSQDHDMASRTSAVIDEHVDWIFSEVLGGKAVRLLDLGCGPGLYAHRLATKGCECVGIDFSPASIRHAQEVAAKDDLSCEFVHADLREASFGEGFDLVMLVFGQLNVFTRDRATEILAKAHAALSPGGRLVLELQTAEQIKKNAAVGPSWYTAPSALFSDKPHLVLQENFWNEEKSASTTRFLVVDAESGTVSNYALSNEAYSNEQVEEMLRSAGFGEMRWHRSLRGDRAESATDLPVVVAVR